MSLRVQFWGTRGSIPSPGPRTVRYGGNTPCVEVRTTDGWLIILDAGTGMRELGRSLLGRANGAPIKGDIFLTHFRHSLDAACASTRQKSYTRDLGVRRQAAGYL